MSIIAVSPMVGPIALDVVISESHFSSIEITGNPIETGAEVNDHAYVKPKEVSLDIADSNAAATFNALVVFQESRVPFFLMTGLKMYEDMLIQSIDAFRDKDTNAILSATVNLKQVIIVSTATASNDSSSSNGQTGKPGGKDSQKSAKPSKKLATDSGTKNRASNTVTRGDTSAKTVKPTKGKSLAKSVFG